MLPFAPGRSVRAAAAWLAERVSDRGDLLARSLHLRCDRTLFDGGLEHTTVQLSRSLGCLSRGLRVHPRFFGVLASALARSASRLGFDS